MKGKIVIVGGVAGGATAAARIRRLDEDSDIVVFERSGFVSYANCGLPYFVGGVITDRDELTLQTPESFRSRYRVDVRVRHEVTAIFPAEKRVAVRDLTTGKTFSEPYDKLLLAPGAAPVVPDVPGADMPELFTLRTVEDTLRLRRAVAEKKPRTAVIAGGGFIGLELAENLMNAGVQVTIVQRPRQLLNTLDADMAAFVHEKAREKGVGLLLGRTVAGFEKTDGGVRVLIKDEPPLEADMAVLAVGVRPETRLAKEAGLKLGEKDAILVNDRMETSAPDIYAVGDAVQIRYFLTGEPALVPLAGPANRQARIAADNICGRNARYDGAQGTSIVRLFDLTAASTGLNEKAAEKAGLAFGKLYLSPLNHAGYYPGAAILTMKVLFEKDTFRLLGAQIVGGDGVDKRIDVLAAAIREKRTAPALNDLELAYAPPYSSAKDPVNMAGYMAENLQSGLVRQFFWHDVAALPRDGSVTLLDVRTPGEYARGHIDGFMNIPVDTLRDRLGELPPGKPVYVHCQTGLRSYIACRILAQKSLACYNLSGGYRLYKTVTEDLKAL